MNKILLLLLLIAIPVVSRAAVPEFPTDNFSIDWVSQFDNSADQMVDQDLGVFIPEGQTWLTAILTIMLVYALVISLLSGKLDTENAIATVFGYLIAYGMLYYYDSPMPWGSGISFHQIFSAESRYLTGLMDLSTLNNLAGELNTIRSSLETPGPLNIFGTFIYAGSVVQIVFIWWVSLLISCNAYYAMAMGSLFGPIMIPFFIWPYFSGLFYGWIRFMIVCMLWRVCNAAALHIYCNLILSYVNLYIGTDYTLGHVFQCLLMLAPLTLTALVGILFSGVIAIAITSGHPNLTSPLIGIAKAAAARFV